MVSAAAPQPVGPFSCPRCHAPASASDKPQTCGKCLKDFVLRAGTRVDPAVIPPPIDRSVGYIKSRAAGLVTIESSIVAPDGVLQGTLDPITGFIPLDQAGIPYGDIVSIAIWRSFDVLRIIGIFILLVPLALVLLAGSIAFPPLLIGALPIAAVVGVSVYGAVVVRRNYARVTGSLRTVTLQFHSPLWRRRRFHDELLRRAGLTPSVIP